MKQVIVVSILATFIGMFGGYYRGKSTADRWYATHPIESPAVPLLNAVPRIESADNSLTASLQNLPDGTNMCRFVFSSKTTSIDTAEDLTVFIDGHRKFETRPPLPLVSIECENDPFLRGLLR